MATFKMNRTQILCFHVVAVVCGLVIIDIEAQLRDDNLSLGPGDDRDATRIFRDQARNSQQINMTRYLLSLVSSKEIADAPEASLNNLSRDQFTGVGNSFKRSRNSDGLNTLINKLDKDNAIILAHQMAIAPHNLTRNLRVNLVQALTKKLGEPATWSSSDIKRIGGELLKELEPDDVTKMADKSRYLFESLVDELLNITRVSRSVQKAIGDGAKRIMGDPIKWDYDVVGRYAKFLSPKDLKTLRPDSVLGAVDKLAKLNGLQAIQARELVNKLSHSTAFGSIDQWNAIKLKRLGQLARGLTIKDIASIKLSYVVSDAKEELGKINVTIAQARALVQHIKTVEPTSVWSASYLRETGYLVKGLAANDFRSMKKQTVNDALETLKAVSNELSLEQIRKIAVHIEDTSQWTNQKASKIGNLCYGKTAKELKEIPYNAIEGLMDNMSPQSNNVDVLKRSLKSAFFQLSLLNLNKAGPICSVLTLNDLKNTDVKKELGIGDYGSGVKWLPWRHDQASQLVKKVIDLKGEPDKWSEELVRSLSERSLLRGLSRKDISKLPLSNFTLEEFSKDKKLLSGQKEAIIKAFASKRGFNKATLGAVDSMGGILIETERDNLDKLSRDVRLRAVRQMGEVDLKNRLFPWINQKLRAAMKILGREYSSQLTSNDVIQLGNLVCGLTSSDIKELKNEVFDDTMNFLGQRICFDESQLKVLAEKAKDVFKKDGLAEDVLPRITSNELFELGCIVEGFTPNDLKNLSQATVKDKVNFLGMRNLTADQAKAVIERLQSSQRKRRDIDVSTIKSAELVAMGNLLKGLSPANIITISKLEYADAATAIGNVDGFTREQLEAWATKAKEAWSQNVEYFSSSEMLRLGAVAIGFKDKDIDNMPFTTDDVIASLGSQKIQTVGVVGYNRSQLRSALQRIIYLKKKTINLFISNDIANLKNFAVAMTPSEIDSIHESTFLNCIGSLGRLTGWSRDQMTTMKRKAMRVYGSIDKWTPAHVAGAGSIIGGFSGSELQSLSDEQIAMVTADAIKSIPPALFKEFKSSQLKEFDSTQASSVTSDQLNELPEASKEMLKRKMGYEKPAPSLGAIHQSNVILLTAALCTAILKTILDDNSICL